MPSINSDKLIARICAVGIIILLSMDVHVMDIEVASYRESAIIIVVVVADCVAKCTAGSQEQVRVDAF